MNHPVEALSGLSKFQIFESKQSFKHVILALFSMKHDDLDTHKCLNTSLKNFRRLGILEFDKKCQAKYYKSVSFGKYSIVKLNLWTNYGSLRSKESYGKKKGNEIKEQKSAHFLGAQSP